MLTFKELSLNDKGWIDEILKKSGYTSEEYNFTFMYIWRDVFSYTAAKFDDFLILKSEKKGRPPTFLFPPGEGDIVKAVEAIKEYIEPSGLNLVFHAMTADGKDRLEKVFPEKFIYIELTDFFDYVYDSEKMIKLSGKKLSSKRNHINAFLRECENWSYEPISNANIADIFTMSEQWTREESEKEHSTSFESEIRSVKYALDNFFALGLKGGAIRVNGQIVAFSVGDRLTDDMFIVHIEKAFRDVRGAYPMINQQFAEHEASSYRYINREDDSGDLGLRTAKQSYQPVFLIEKYGAKMI